MLTIVVLGEELFDDESQEFTTRGDVALELEHSLVSLSKWEEKYEKPFLGEAKKTAEELFEYIKFMIITPDVPEEIFTKFSEANIADINRYIDAKMSATWFNDSSNAPRTRDIITAELVYYWMITFQIPFECQYWHLNRLFTLIRVCNNKQAKPKKMSRAEIAARNRDLNAQRRRESGTTG